MLPSFSSIFKMVSDGVTSRLATNSYRVATSSSAVVSLFHGVSPAIITVSFSLPLASSTTQDTRILSEMIQSCMGYSPEPYFRNDNHEGSTKHTLTTYNKIIILF